MEPPNLPSACGCGEPFNSQHALSCLLGGYRGLMHNELRDLYESLFKAAGFKVEAEPVLLPLTGETFKLKSANTDEHARPESSGVLESDATSIL